MRTVKASEVRKGMRVEVITEAKGVEHRVRGEVREVDTVTESTWITFADNRSEEMHANDPATVLAEPEPEWVEGAWYWVSHRAVMENRVMRRVTRGWSISSSHDLADYSDDEVTVLGRVLIVDWPGHDVARTLAKWPDGTAPLRDLDRAVENVADAIRTQGGAR